MNKTFHSPYIHRLNDFKEYPKISIVIPCLNQVSYLEAAILSILEQGYPNLELVVIDGGSKDGSIEIIKKYNNYLHYWHSQPDEGQYYAIQEGFSHTSGEVMAWLGSDDMLHRNALWAVAEVFDNIPKVQWLMGNPTLIDARGLTIYSSGAPRWSRLRIMLEKSSWIQQESVFWRRGLW